LLRKTICIVLVGGLKIGSLLYSLGSSPSIQRVKVPQDVARALKGHLIRLIVLVMYLDRFLYRAIARFVQGSNAFGGNLPEVIIRIAFSKAGMRVVFYYAVRSLIGII